MWNENKTIIFGERKWMTLKNKLESIVMEWTEEDIFKFIVDNHSLVWRIWR